MNREAELAKLGRTSHFDVLVIGAGINGIGVFHDLACQGLKVLMVDRGDFCSGTSAASSHMAHGGIRYLEYGDFRLVREAIQERNRLLANAPHFVKPLPTRIPLFAIASGFGSAIRRFLGFSAQPAVRGAWLIQLSLLLYDSYSRTVRNTLPKSYVESRRSSLTRFPRLNPAIKASAHYHDALILHPERLALELIQAALARNPACVALNYVEATDLAREGVRLQDAIEGSEHEIRCDAIVNAAGPWIDRVNERLDAPSDFVLCSKGSHLVVDHPPLREAIGDHMWLFENTDGRYVLICPFHHRVLLGTTDIPVENPDGMYCTPEELQYMLDMVQVPFPQFKLTPDCVVFHYSGVRPLAQAQGPVAAVSRDHIVQRTPASDRHPAIYSLVGGKWTTFRAFSEQTADMVMAQLQRERKVSTRNQAIGGGAGFPLTDRDFSDYVKSLEVPDEFGAERLERLLGRYGTQASHVLAHCLSHADPTAAIADSTYLRAEIEYICHHEMVAHLDDLVLRRTLMAMLGHLSTEALERTASLAGAILGWDDERRREELERCRHLLRHLHGVSV